MLILAVDTSGSNCSVALFRDDALLGETNMNYGRQHSVLLMPMIEELMAQTSIRPNELTHLVIDLGPGSFTGLRIGLSVVEAMAYALKLPLYGYTSFAAAHEPLRHVQGDVLILHDALKKTFYCAAWHHELDSVRQTLDDDVRSLDELVERFGSDASLVIAGDALNKYAEDIQAAFPQAILIEDSRIQRASHLARLCFRDVRAGVPPQGTHLPRYMRKPQAQREYEATHGHDLDQ